MVMLYKMIGRHLDGPGLYSGGRFVMERSANSLCRNVNLG